LGVNVPGVDIFANDGMDALVTNLEYTNAAGYLTVPAATYDIDIAVSPGTAADSVLAADGVALRPGSSSTAVAYGELSRGLFVALLDDGTDGLDAANMRVNVMHGAYDVGEVDIWNITDMSAPAPLLVDVDFGDVANVDLPVASYVLGFDVDNDERVDLSFTIPELPGGAVYEVIATSDDTGVYLSAFLPDNTFVRIDADS
jgi:hypothetical protein